MASFNVEVDDTLMGQLKKLGAVDRLAPLMIDEASPILEKQVKQELERHKVSGDLQKSVKRTKAALHKSGGYFSSIEPTGTDRKGVRNVEKLVYLEYGTSRQPATPILTKAAKDSEASILAAMQAIFDREVGKT